MGNMLKSLTMGAVLAFALTTLAAAGAADPIIGTWKLNLEKSKFTAGTAPKSETRTYAAAANGTTLSATGVAADGSPTSMSATLTYDGKDCPVTGSSAFDTLVLKKVNGTTVKADHKKDGKVVGHTTRTVSDHGKVLTLMSSSKTAKGGTVHATAVYDKQ